MGLWLVGYGFYIILVLDFNYCWYLVTSLTMLFNVWVLGICCCGSSFFMGEGCSIGSIPFVSVSFVLLVLLSGVILCVLLMIGFGYVYVGISFLGLVVGSYMLVLVWGVWGYMLLLVSSPKGEGFSNVGVWFNSYWDVFFGVEGETFSAVELLYTLSLFVLSSLLFVLDSGVYTVFLVLVYLFILKLSDSEGILNSGLSFCLVGLLGVGGFGFFYFVGWGHLSVLGLYVVVLFMLGMGLVLGFTVGNPSFSYVFSYCMLVSYMWLALLFYAVNLGCLGYLFWGVSLSSPLLFICIGFAFWGSVGTGSSFGSFLLFLYLQGVVYLVLGCDLGCSFVWVASVLQGLTFIVFNELSHSLVIEYIWSDVASVFVSHFIPLPTFFAKFSSLVSLSVSLEYYIGCLFVLVLGYFVFMQYTYIHKSPLSSEGSSLTVVLFNGMFLLSLMLIVLAMVFLIYVLGLVTSVLLWEMMLVWFFLSIMVGVGVSSSYVDSKSLTYSWKTSFATLTLFSFGILYLFFVSFLGLSHGLSFVLVLVVGYQVYPHVKKWGGS